MDRVIEKYREFWNASQAEDLDVFRDAYAEALRHLRYAWKEWQGEDSLHEMAFGEPEE